jgi:mono/diheme cytochrome c family protein
VAEHKQRGIREIVTLHVPKLAQPRADFKLRPAIRFLLNLLPVSGVICCDRNQTKLIPTIKMTMNPTKLTLAALAASFSFAVAASAQDAATPAAPMPPVAPLPPASAKTGLTYVTDIKPVFDANCVKCHSGDKPKAHLHLDTLDGILKGNKWGPVLKAGDGVNSLIVKAVGHQLKDKDGWMPPMPNKAEAKTLTPEQIGLVIAWINQGAK